MTEEDSKLSPAKYEEDGTRPFAQSLPWKPIVVGVLLLSLFVGGYLYFQGKRRDALRDQVAQRFASSVRPAVPKIKEFEEQINSWVFSASKNPNPETWAVDNFNIEGLHAGQGVYLRILEANTTDANKIAVATQLAEQDVVTNCLGIAPLTLKSLYAISDLTGDAWLSELANTHDYMRLSVMQEQLSNRISRDLPVLLNVVQSDYLILLIVRGESRFDSPVDVYIWDIKRKKPLLRTRTKANGILVTAKIALDGSVGGAATPGPKKSGAADCSIASQIRAAAGRGLIQVESEERKAEAQVDSNEAESNQAGSNKADPSGESRMQKEAVPVDLKDPTEPG